MIIKRSKETDVKNSKYLGFICALAVLSLPLLGTANAANIVMNPGFETGDFSDWQVFGENGDAFAIVQSGDNGPAAPGNHNAFLSNQAEAIGLLLKQTTPVGSAGPGAVDYSYDILLDQADVGGVVFVEIFAEQEGVGIIGGSGLMGPLWAWDWTTYEGSFVAPDGTDFLTIQFVATTGANPDSNCLMHVDNVSLDQGSVATESMSWGSTKVLY